MPLYDDDEVMDMFYGSNYRRQQFLHKILDPQDLLTRQDAISSVVTERGYCTETLRP